MEPKSQFYTDPVIVLDFQSLYPSMVLAYNLFYTTCLGRFAKPAHLPSPPYSSSWKRKEGGEGRRWHGGGKDERAPPPLQDDRPPWISSFS